MTEAVETSTARGRESVLCITCGHGSCPQTKFEELLVQRPCDADTVLWGAHVTKFIRADFTENTLQ